MEIKPIDCQVIGQKILNLDKTILDENPSIFLQETSSNQGTFDNKVLNNLLYDC